MAKRKKQPPIVELKLPKREKKILSVNDTIEILNASINLLVSAKVAEYSAAVLPEIINRSGELLTMATNGFTETQKNFFETVDKKFK